MFDSSNVYLVNLLRVGDTCITNYNEKDESWSYVKDEDRARQGKVCKVVGFTEREHFVEYYGYGVQPNRLPGVYRTVGQPIVSFRDNPGEHVKVDTSSLSWWPWETTNPGLDLIDALRLIREHAQKMNEKRHAERGSFDEEWIRFNEYVRPLPECGFWIGDVVELAESDSTSSNNMDGQFVVERIDYHSWNKVCSDGSPFPVIGVKSLAGDYSTSAKFSELKLINRGNVWKWYNNRKQDMVFLSLQEELRFYQGLGRLNEVRNPETKVYSFTLKEAREAIKQQLGDFISKRAGYSYSVYKCYDRELSKRVHALAGQQVIDF